MSESAAPDFREQLSARIRSVPDFPRPGILFRDITPLLADGPLFARTIERMATECARFVPDRIVAVESRGFIFGAPLAARLERGLVIVRKPGKLPHRTQRIDYALEYGSDALETHEDGIRPGQRVLIVDDVLATGGTALAAARLIERMGGRVVGVVVLLELVQLQGRRTLGDIPVYALLEDAAGD